VDLVGAQERWEHAVSLWEKAHGPKHPFLALLLTDVGKTELRRGRPARARKVLERAFSIADLEQVEAGDRGELRYALARALWDAGGDRKRARELATAAHQDLSAAGPRAARRAGEVKAWLDAR